MSDVWTYFDTISCASVEGCVSGTGWRRLLRFTVSALNQGYLDLAPGDPSDMPELFEYSPCHAHFHFEDFARYYLLETTTQAIALTGRKQAYCMLDSHRVFDGMRSPCQSAYSCENQGVSVGWVDTYSQSLDCQWLDITDVAPGSYDLYVVLNPRRIFHESSWENNGAKVRVTIAVSAAPPPPQNTTAPFTPPPYSAGNPNATPLSGPVSVPVGAPGSASPGSGAPGSGAPGSAPTNTSAPKAKAPTSVNSAGQLVGGSLFLFALTLALLL